MRRDYIIGCRNRIRVKITSIIYTAAIKAIPSVICTDLTNGRYIDDIGK